MQLTFVDLGEQQLKNIAQPVRGQLLLSLTNLQLSLDPLQEE